MMGRRRIESEEPADTERAREECAIRIKVPPHGRA